MPWSEERMVRKDLELTLVPGIGGRLMDIKYQGVSLLFQNPDLVSHVPDLENLKALPSRASHFPFPLWGGEKTWIAPDSLWPDDAPHPTLDSGEYAFEKADSHNAILTSRVCPASSLQIRRQISLNDSNSWTILHRITNLGAQARKVGLWSVMMTRRPASYFCRISPKQIPVTVFGTPEDAFSFIDDIGVICCDEIREFKLGIHPASNVSAARISTDIGDVWLVIRASALGNARDYAHGQALEFFNSGHYDYAELEWHSPAEQLQPGHSFELKLDYSVYLETSKQSPSQMFDMIESGSDLPL